MIFRTLFSDRASARKTRSFRRVATGVALIALCSTTATAQTPASNDLNASTNASASEIWSNFLFGSADSTRRRATPRFVFSAQDEASVRASQAARAPVARPSSNAPSNFNADIRSSRNFNANVASRTSASARNDSGDAARVADGRRAVAAPSAPEESRADARRRRLQELNAILAARRPDEFARRVAATNDVRFDADFDPNFDPSRTARNDAAARLEELCRAGTQAVDERPTSNADAAAFDAARANRSKIRQASHFETAAIASEPTADDFVDDALGFAFLPVRPNALRVAPRVFLSTEIVALPNAGPLETDDSAGDAAPEVAPVVASAVPAAPVASVAPTAETVVARSSSEPSPRRAEFDASTASRNAATGVPVFRPASAFVDPRTVPDKR